MATKKAAKKAAKKTTRKSAARPRKAAAAKTVPAAVPAAKTKPAREFAYMVSTPTRDEKGVVNGSKSEFQGPFTSEKNALDDASLMSGDEATITLYKAVKRGSVQKTTRFVAAK